MGSRTSATSSLLNPHRVSLRAIALSSVLTIALSATAFARVNPRKIPPPSLGHTFIILEENRGFGAVVGNSGEALNWAYFNSLVSQGALVTNGFAVGHPSIDNYFELTIGKPITHKDKFNRVVKGKNVIDALSQASKTWKVYAEDLPANPISDGPDPYEKHHNPFAYFQNVVNSTQLQSHLVDLTELSTDESNNTLPDYAFIIPNACHSGHGVEGTQTPCTNDKRNPALDLAADNFLKNGDSANNISPLVPGILSSLQAAGSGVLIITWDEGEDPDHKHGGGHVATLLLGPQVKAGYRQTLKNVYTHASTLRLMIQALGGHLFPGASRGAPMMGEFFTGAQM